MKPITVVLVEDHAVVREGFRVLLELEPGMRVIGEAEDGRKAVQVCKDLQPDVVLMDIAMPRLNGLEAARSILKAQPGTRILLLTAYNDDAYIHEATQMGCAGFLLKHSSAGEVLRAIRAVMKGGTFSSPAVARRQRRLQASHDRPERFRGKAPALTPREREVLQLIAEGKANKETAAELGIAIKTVEKHREHLMRKLDIHDTAGLTRYAIASGVIEVEVPTRKA